ncbi:prephenate dehydrogenase [Microbacterium sp. EYE_5]|uniref:prephenate dehydrogenase n=1 Tax=unclassified Microbacterium TaxID=2609290 RepID=UPI00200441BF|nr:MULTISPECIES: prephenate dehydrogenase [unclassified Microbacterium]MCK6080396.1 prephenate dehydrogenase [Microbacterium sp. EYE_382]MCK6085667.1 prephenate dehydrogenase [Microbacterium sp. EYE_384]MCK6124835.1 prephenate dehydrogenase [Microbacterium sp. EYE_80]MCK6127744.1 prephenate dehydrogenase [Microbacterium sp. EYE_79]MCK6141351.1 prephenate dehydrogenase [Microbacterium sp. EYE_39]
MTDAIDARARAVRTSGTVRIVGAGLLGSSVGHALRSLGVDVVLADASPAQLRLAVDYGAGRLAAADDQPSLVVVAVPPDVTADVIERELAAFPGAVVTDVASVKLEPLQTLRSRGVDLTRYIGSHPMAGRERGGAISARADIFFGRPWVICRDEETSARDLAVVEGLALDLGATPIEMTPEEHDRSVALVSHVPQLVASLLAGRFVAAEDGSLRLAGQGVRDTTRIAASAPELWVQILGANAEPVVDVLDALARDLSGVAAALRAPDAPGSRRAVADTIRRGNEGVERLPGKHGQNRRYETVVVMVDDTPGQLGRLFGDLGELEVNVEDFRLEHSPGAQFGLGEISVVPSAVSVATDGLAARGWKIASLND